MNDYSPTWYELFLLPLAAEQTEREAAFVAHWLPLPAYSAVLDLCCAGFDAATPASAEMARMQLVFERFAQGLGDGSER